LIRINKNKFITFFLVLIFLVLAYIPNRILPMVSDDFWYGAKDTNLFLVSIQHYLGWSGRLLTDVTSRVILQYPGWLLSGIKAIALVSLIVLIALLPSMILEKNVFSRVNLYLMFVIYWICNPNLGQTTFWTVGASNYLFTSVWIMAYLNLVFFLFNHNKKWYTYIILMIVALFAGLSNENTAPVLVIFSLCMLIFAKYKVKNVIPWLIGFGFNLLGSLILLLSPGNKVRIQNLPPDVKTGFSIQNIYDFFTNGTAAKLFSNYGFLFLIFVIMVVFLFFKKTISKTVIFWSLTFFLLAILSNFAFVLSPVTMIRSLQGAFVFFLVSLSFLITELMSTPNSKIVNIVFAVMICLATAFFSVSYVLEVHSFELARAEGNIRQSIILNAKKNNKPSAAIPGWYYGTLLRPENDSYDSFFSYHMGEYYGYKGAIQEVSAPIDYTKSATFKHNYLKVSGSKLVYGIKFEEDKISKKITTVILLKKIVKKDDLVFHIRFKNKRVEEYNVPLDNSVNARGNKFISINLGTIYKDNLDKINIVIKDKDDVNEKIVLSTSSVYKLI